MCVCVCVCVCVWVGGGEGDKKPTMGLLVNEWERLHRVVPPDRETGYSVVLKENGTSYQYVGSAGWLI